MTTPAPAGETPRVSTRVPAELLEAARRAYGQPDASNTTLIRAGLAALAGLPVDAHAAPLPTYRPRQAQRAA
ncbi:MAG: hypothetical protein ACRDJ9_15730 [Dehalococcoidia bacterium]